MSAKSNEVVKLAAELLRLPLSDVPEDWPKSMPKSALRAIAKQEDRLKDAAVRVRYAADCLRELDTALAAAHEQIAALTAERDRLREALERIKDDPACDLDSFGFCHIHREDGTCPDEIADAALRTADEGDSE